MSIRETLELDIQPALDEVTRLESLLKGVADEFGNVLVEALTAALENLPVIKPEVDAESAQTEVEQALEQAAADPLMVDVDESAITDEVAQAVDAAVSQPQQLELDFDSAGLTAEVDAALNAVEGTVDATVNLDTSQAEESLTGLGTESTSATEKINNTGSALEGLDGIAGIASGGMGGLTDKLKGIGPGGIAAAIGVGFAVGEINKLYNEALLAEQVSQTFNSSLGDLAPRILDLSGGATGLTGDMTKLTQQIGSSDEAVLPLIQRFANLHTATGATDDDVVDLSQKFFGLAVQIRANNPAAGELDGIMGRLNRALSRGGAFMSQYGIDLDKTAIKQRALADTGKESADQLTFAELQAAGLNIAFEQLDPNMESIREGMENVGIRAEYLEERFGDAREVIGAPLVVPMLDLIEASQDPLLTVAEAVASLGRIALPLVTGAFQILGKTVEPIGKLLTMVADTAEDLSEGLYDVAEGIGAVNKETGEFEGLLPEGMTTAIGDFLGPLGTALRMSTDYKAIQDDMNKSFEEAEPAITKAEEAAEELTEEFGPNALQMALQGTTFFAYRAKEALEGWGAAALNAIPTTVQKLNEILSAESTWEQISVGLGLQTVQTQQWLDSMVAMQKEGQTALLSTVAQLGPEKSALLLEQYGGDLNLLNAYLQEVINAEMVARQNVRIIMAEEYLRAKGVTEEGVKEIIAAYKDNLLLDEPTSEALDEAIAVFDLEKDAAAAAAKGVADAATGPNGLGSGVDDAKQAGEDTGQGFLDGLGESLSNLWQRGGDFARQVLAGLDQVLNFGSPSKVMREQGALTAQGFILGMADELANVTSVANAVASAAGAPLRGLNGTVGVEALTGAQALTGPGNVNNIEITVPVTVGQGMTSEQGQAVGNAVATTISGELRRLMILEARAA